MSDKKIIREALTWYLQQRLLFAGDMAQVSYRKRDGSTPTQAERKEAWEYADRVSALIRKFSDDRVADAGKTMPDPIYDARCALQDRTDWSAA